MSKLYTDMRVQLGFDTTIFVCRRHIHTEVAILVRNQEQNPFLIAVSISTLWLLIFWPARSNQFRGLLPVDHGR